MRVSTLTANLNPKFHGIRLVGSRLDFEPPPPPQTKEKRKLSLHNSVQHDRTQSSVFLRNQTSRNNRNWEKQMSDVVCVCVCDRRFLAFKVTSFVRPQVGPGATRRWRHRGAYGPNNLQSPLAGNAFGPPPPPSVQPGNPFSIIQSRSSNLHVST